MPNHVTNHLTREPRVIVEQAWFKAEHVATGVGIRIKFRSFYGHCDSVTVNRMLQVFTNS